MSIYPSTIARCQHIKINGTQCGSPALRGGKLCYFHKKWRNARIVINPNPRPTTSSIDLPVLEDANSIQISLMQVMRLIASGQIDVKSAGLLLYALQTASNNLRQTKFDPWPHDVVIHPEWVAETGLGENAWKNEHFAEEEQEGPEEEQEEDNLEGDEKENEKVDETEDEKKNERVDETENERVHGTVDDNNRRDSGAEGAFDPVAMLEEIFNKRS